MGSPSPPALPCSALCLAAPWVLLELPLMVSAPLFHFDFVIMTLNALCTFALNVSVFLVILHTSALTARVAGVVKDWVVVLLSSLLFQDTKLTAVNIVGYAIAIGGVVMYNRFKLQAPSAAAQQALKAEDQGGEEVGEETTKRRVSVGSVAHTWGISLTPLALLAVVSQGAVRSEEEERDAEEGGVQQRGGSLLRNREIG